ncbi:MAG: SdiA-regulated domain-containing protein [Bacteroidia bacterium]|nr:SdiA-regulated domain-containing protein [Bacteroidia bacterium]MCZ2277383.1 SdiA-regulated domain-containing protein [Bacteroidia bacterium]
MKIYTILLALFLLPVLAASQAGFRYNLKQPSIELQLPEILHEVSGLTDIDYDHVACVQDELGIVFMYNFRTGKITAQHRFDSVGDFEGLTYANKNLFILRSDGRLTEWKNFPDRMMPLRNYQLPLSTSNNEGLCYDSKFNRLLIAAKSKPMNHDYKSERFIYAYDLAAKKLQKKPLLSLNVNYLEAVAKSYNIHQRDTNSKGAVKPFNLRPSSLAIHPVTDEIYLISAADKLLITMNRKGEVTYMQSLNPVKFLKAEGITFLADGTMIITNEGVGQKPTLYVFEMQND